MCFGGGQAPSAPMTTPAASVDQITAGGPTITAAPGKVATSTPNPATNPAAPAPRTPGTFNQNNPGNLGM